LFEAYPQTVEPIVTDRPDITESAVTVPLQTLQIETGFTFQHNLESNNGFNTEINSYSLAGTLLRYGIFSVVELRAGTELLLNRIESNGQTENINGISGLLIGAKIQLIRDNADLPDAALFIHFNLPVGSEDLKPDKAEPEIILAASHSIGDPFSLSYNFGGTWESAEEIIHYFYSASLGIGLSGRTGMYAEIFGDVSSARSVSYNLDGGFTYLLFENLQADIAAGFELDKPGDNWFVGTGLSLRIPK
jgi:hypothetical protein